MNKKIIRIYLVSGTIVPKWIGVQTKNVSVENKEIKERKIRILTIKGGKASFFPGGTVCVKMPGSDYSYGAFGSLKTLKITDARGKVLEINHYFCEKCFTNAGKIIGKPRKTEIWSKFDADFQCSICGNEYTRRI